LAEVFVGPAQLTMVLMGLEFSSEESMAPEKM
jgi:hypothetical protein